MTTEVLVPTLPESVTDATVVGWHRNRGDAVQRDDNLVDLETDKVVLEVPAPTDGVLVRLMKKDGDIVNAGDVLAVIEEQGVTTVETRGQCTIAGTARPGGPPPAGGTQSRCHGDNRYRQRRPAGQGRCAGLPGCAG